MSETPDTELSCELNHPSSEGGAVDVENQTIGCEKVDSVESMAEAGFPVPEHRQYLSADLFCESAPSVEVVSFLSSILAQEVRRIFVRSVHPRESEFSGGAFESVSVRVVDGDTVDSLWEKVCKARERMIDLAKPESSLQIRRDIRHKGIEGFDPSDMGVYLNEQLNSRDLVTVVPLSDGRLSFRFLSVPGFYGSRSLAHVDLCREDLSHLSDDVLRLVSGIGSSIGMGGVKNGGVVEPVDFLETAFQAQDVFDSPQEMEMHVVGGGPVFVQAKAVMPEPSEDVEILEEEFEKGFGTSLEPYDNCRPDNGFYNETDISVSKANNRAERRDTKLLIIDEMGWLKDADLFDGQGLRGGMLMQRFDTVLRPASYYLDPIIDGDREPDAYDLRKQKEGAKIREVLLAKYRELVALAEEYPEYTLWFKNCGLTFCDNHERGIPELVDVRIAREQLVKSASVQMRGSSKHYDGMLNESAHYSFGTVGPRQIGILSHDRVGFALPEGGRIADGVDHPAREALGLAENGDDFVVMVRREARTYGGRTIDKWAASLRPDVGQEELDARRRKNRSSRRGGRGAWFY